MSGSTDLRDAVLALETSPGDLSLRLRLGAWVVSIDGLDDDLVRRLERRWGGFVTGSDPAKPDLTLELLVGAERFTLGTWAPGEIYVLEAELVAGAPLVRSHHFSVTPVPDSADRWRAAIVRSDREAPDRIVENVVRYLTGRLVAEHGGLALHAAGVLKDDRAYVFAGPSGSGKTTAVGLSAPAVSLGDDFAVLFPVEGSWRTVALPFDNRENAPSDPPGGDFPVAGVWRLYHADRARVESPPPALSVASLMGCAAFPWAMPDLSDRVLEHAGSFVRESVYAHLHFAKESIFWELIESSR